VNDLILGLGIALALEGALYALLPNQMRSLFARLLDQPDRTFRIFGLGSLVLGLGLVWLVRG